VRDPDIRPVAIGDLVRWRSVQNDEQEALDIDIGIVLSLSRSGANSLAVQVLFDDNTIDWLPAKTLEIISKG
jgi:hypothetical protein|tara:strand:+ start:1737 stop:1952 length:216 start_codon:yes stop_codon:yes gene_type:complete